MLILNLLTPASHALFCGLIAVGFIASSAAAEELTPQQAVENFANSVALVKNYDVTVTATNTRIMKLVTDAATESVTGVGSRCQRATSHLRVATLRGK